MLATDGQTLSTITLTERSAAVRREGSGFTFEALTDGAVVSRLGVAEPCRNGAMDACVAEVAGRTIRARIDAAPKPGS
jgi:hypothetical protein